MSRKYIITIIIACVFAGTFLLFNYYYTKIDAEGVPVSPVTVAGREVKPISADVKVPVLWGLFEKHMNLMLGNDGWTEIPEGAVFDMQDPAAYLALLGEAPYKLEIDMPEGMQWTVSITDKGLKKDEIGFQEGKLKQEVVIQQAGEYEIILEGKLEKSENTDPEGVFYYRAYFSVGNPLPLYKEGRLDLQQGDILSLKIENLPDGIRPEIETKLGPAIFTKGVPQAEGAAEDKIKLNGLSDWYAIIPISNSCYTGEYTVCVTAGDQEYETIVKVYEYEFDFQDMIIDTSVPTVAAATSGEAISEFREKITPLIPLISEDRFWDGLFIMPVEPADDVVVSTEFGEVRITNGNQNTKRSHLGLDIAADKGTPVYASNAGKVLLSEFLLNTGNTVIIDHGGGLKSFYYHMDSAENLAGTVVGKGDLIGRVGSTGYSTGPHLHFEMRVGEYPVSPSMLFDPGAGLYSAL